jgi:hypothetical protein
MQCKFWSVFGCLLQPRLFYLRIQKSMREEFNPLIKSCCTGTVPAAETKSIGLQADARVVMVFASPSGQFYLDKKPSSIYRDFAKTHANPDTDGNSLNRRAVSTNWLPKIELATRRNLLIFIMK